MTRTVEECDHSSDVQKREQKRCKQLQMVIATTGQIQGAVEIPVE